jgi:hypothetical protein
MKKEDLKISFDQIKPSESAKKRMLDNILSHSDRKKGTFMTLFNFKKAIPALALVTVIAGGLLAYSMLGENSFMLRENNHYDSAPEYNSVTDDVGSGREDAVAPLLDQFQIDDRHYMLLFDDLRVDYGLPATVSENDIGEKITDITVSPDKNMIGSEVYSYIPAGGEAIVAVKKDNGYQLFRFFTFESYNNNQDEDSVEYLKLYGINKADDIAKIQFIGHSEQSKLEGRTDILGEITNRDEIARFYGFYSVLKNSSNKYFDRLFNYNNTGTGNKGIEIDTAVPNTVTTPPDYVDPDPVKPADQMGYGEDLPMDIASDRVDAVVDLPLKITEDESVSISGNTPTSNDDAGTVSPPHGIMDMGDTGSGSTEPSQGSAANALVNPITIRIYNQNGVYFDSVYYKNFGFISRYEVSKDFADFIGKYINE